jgi:hypothetical protein
MSALSALASPPKDNFIEAMATATNIQAPALYDLAAKVSADEYARFIHHVMKVSPTLSAEKVTIRGTAAVPV